MPSVVGVAAVSLAQRVSSSRVAKALPATAVAFAIALGVAVRRPLALLLGVKAAGRWKTVTAVLSEQQRYACDEHKGDHDALDESADHGDRWSEYTYVAKAFPSRPLPVVAAPIGP